MSFRHLPGLLVIANLLLGSRAFAAAGGQSTNAAPLPILPPGMAASQSGSNAPGVFQPPAIVTPGQGAAQPAVPAAPAQPVAQVPPPVTAPPQPATTPTPYLAAGEELKQIFLQEGYSLELVVSDPDIQDPVLAAFDGNGRMYVAEMRSYMPTIDGGNQAAPVSRISVHWSSKGDGHFDRHAVFADNLVLPRMILPLDDGLLVNETYSDAISYFRDTNGDGIADVKEPFFPGGANGGNLEHQPSGLIWAMDNWMYMAANPSRLRINGSKILREPTPSNMGQWGLTQDDYGKPWFSNAGYESGPVNFEMHILYGDFQIEEQMGGDFYEVWPLVGLGDYQGGPVRVRPNDKTLNHFTATCGQDIFRGDRLPADLRGDLLFAEPVGRLIRRAKIEVKEGFTRLHNAYQKEHSEFIRSTDPNFRPVNLVTAPDGTLYIVDMYRGLIQESAWVGGGSYLRGVVQQYELEKNLGRGRIWRLVHKDFQPGPQPHMLGEKSADLVKYLEHPNGWWRDNAQKLIVLHGDKSVIPALAKMVQSGTNTLGRIHALWTMEGLNVIDPTLIRQCLADKDPHVRIAAIRVSEDLSKQGDHSLALDVLALTKDPDPSVVLQVLMTSTLLKWPETQKLIANTIATNAAYGVKTIGGRVAQLATAIPIPQEFTVEERASLARGEQVYKQLCFSCHGVNGMGTPLAGATNGMAKTMAPPFGGSRICNGSRDALINIVLKGLSGPVEGTNYTAQMVPMESNDDTWVASVISYIRNNFGNSSSMVGTDDVARVRAGFKARNVPWTLTELSGTVPQPFGDRWRWKASASHNDQAAALAIDDDPKSRYETKTSQSSNMWYQVKFPWEIEIGGVVLDTGDGSREFPRGFQVELSSDGKSWNPPVATGHGTSAITEVLFPPSRAKYLRVTQTASIPNHTWNIADIQVLHATPPPPPASLLAKKPVTSIYE